MILGSLGIHLFANPRTKYATNQSIDIRIYFRTDTLYLPQLLPLMDEGKYMYLFM